jgi:predicted thioesterase
MKAGFNPGIVREVTMTVTEDMCPAFDGVIIHRVCSTWTMVHYMELAARRVLVDFLDDDEEGVGAHVSVDHRGPAPVGTEVTVRAELIEVRHNRVTCHVAARAGDRLLADGKQVQMVFKRDHLERLLYGEKS